MSTLNRLAEIGALIGEPARAMMLESLLDGRSLTASELARAAGVTPQTASGHLGKLAAADLISLKRCGRHHYYRLAGAEVAGMLEDMMRVASRDRDHPSARKIVTGPRDAAMRTARTCYDHLAGGMAVAIADALIEQGVIEFSDEGGLILEGGVNRLQAMGLALPNTKSLRSSRPLCRPCMDWSERRPHIAGHLGAAICTHAFEKGWVRRINETRALRITPAGDLALREMFGIGRVAEHRGARSGRRSPRWLRPRRGVARRGPGH